jgi:hypothetical protein
MTDKDAMKLALEALEFWDVHGRLHQPTEEAITALKERLAQPEQEPVAHLWECLGRWSAYLVNNGTQAECAPPSWLVEAVKNATTPPQRKPLTKQEMFEAIRPLYSSEKAARLTVAHSEDEYRAIEAKLKEKNTC